MLFAKIYRSWLLMAIMSISMIELQLDIHDNGEQKKAMYINYEYVWLICLTKIREITKCCYIKHTILKLMRSTIQLFNLPHSAPPVEIFAL